MKQNRAHRDLAAQPPGSASPTRRLPGPKRKFNTISQLVQTRLKENDGKVFSSEELIKLLFMNQKTHIPKSHLVKRGLIVSMGSNLWQIKISPPHKVPMDLDPLWKRPMLAGEKLSTTRSYARGRPGDVFDAFGHTWEIISICRFPLWAVSKLFYKVEGCSSPWEFRKLWNKFHPEKPYKRNQKVYVHLFILAKEGS